MHRAEIYLRLSQDRDDAPAWRALEQRVRTRARISLGRHSPELVEDVVANTCTSVVLALDSARGAETFAGFVLGHLLNERRRALHARGGGGLELIGLEQVDVPAPEPDAAEGPEAELLALLHQELAALPSRERRAVVLRYFEDASAVQIGTELGVQPGNARRILCTGLARLRRSFQSRRATAGRGWAVGLPVPASRGHA
jgi:RNA polymerase sigma factor (sigma-70 family)